MKPYLSCIIDDIILELLNTIEKFSILSKNILFPPLTLLCDILILVDMDRGSNCYPTHTCLLFI